MTDKSKKLHDYPKTIRISLHGYGGECYMGNVSRETYEFFKQHEILIEQYAGGGDTNWSFIPEKYQLFSPGCPYDCDGLGHESGATMDDDSFITVEDENGNEIWQSGLDQNTLKKNGVDVKIFDEVNLNDFERGTVVFWGGQGEKGLFFSGEITINSPFDPKKLHISCSNLDGWLLSNYIEYDGEEVDGSDGYDTSGKWGKHKFCIVGDEEVYEGKERDDEGSLYSDEDTPDGYQNSPHNWEKSKKIRNTNPIRIGWYSCNYAHGTTYSSLYWNGDEWQSFSNGRPVKECESVDWWYGYNWDTSDWKNQPKKPPEVRCKKCNWLGSSDEMIAGPENLTSEMSCPICKARNKEIDWINYDPDTKIGQKNQMRYCK